MDKMGGQIIFKYFLICFSRFMNYHTVSCMNTKFFGAMQKCYE